MEAFDNWSKDPGYVPIIATFSLLWLTTLFEVNYGFSFSFLILNLYSTTTDEVVNFELYVESFLREYPYKNVKSLLLEIKLIL